MKAQIGLKHSVEVIKEEEIKNLLKPGEVGATLELIVRDRNGRVTEHRGPMRSKSFVRQFLQLLFIFGAPRDEANTYQVRDTGNVLRGICASSQNFAADAGAGVTTFGIIVGTGNTAPTIDDYVMETPIAHGVGGGQLQYGAATFGAPAYDATTSQFTITRDFANGSGGAIVVNEIGLYVEGYVPAATYYFMTIRDVIGGGINVPNGQTLTVNYRPQATI
jgi:hypothetical protein